MLSKVLKNGSAYSKVEFVGFDAEASEEIGITMEKLKPEIFHTVPKIKTESKSISPHCKVKVKFVGVAPSVKEKCLESFRNKGFKEGYESGIKDANVKASQIVSNVKDKVEKMLENAEKEKEEIIRASEQEIMELIVKLLGNLLANTITINPQIILALVRQGIDGTPIASNAKIIVSQKDYEIVASAKHEIFSYAKNLENLKIVKDGRLATGDCIIETDYGTINTGLTDKFSKLKNDLYLLCSG